MDEGTQERELIILYTRAVEIYYEHYQLKHSLREKDIRCAELRTRLDVKDQVFWDEVKKHEEETERLKEENKRLTEQLEKKKKQFTRAKEYINQLRRTLGMKPLWNKSESD